MSATGARSAGSAVVAPSRQDDRHPPRRQRVPRQRRHVAAGGSSTVEPISSIRASASVMMSNRFMISVSFGADVSHAQSHPMPTAAAVTVRHPSSTAMCADCDISRIVEAVADDETILDREADVLDRDVDHAPRRLAQQARRPQRLRRARPQDVLQVRQRQPGVDDVLDDDDVAALEPESRSFSIRTSPDDLVLLA